MEDNVLPTHIGIIMDGNGRWATKRGLKRSLGHKAGADNLKKLLVHIYKRGIKIASLYTFSTENFKRSKDEVDYIMDLCVKLFTKEAKIFVREKIKVVFSGSKDNLRLDVIEAMESLEKLTSDFNNGILNVCLNYGGRLELIDTFKKLLVKYKEEQISLDEIDENLISSNLYQDLPPLDYVIRTSGEYRISNFMLWQSSYAEFYFTDVLFPDFNNEEFDKALLEYTKRKRRFGGV